VARELAPARLRSSRKKLGAAAQPSGSKLPRHRFDSISTYVAFWRLGDFPYNLLGRCPIRPSDLPQEATLSCASAYNYARIRRLVRLGARR